MPPSEKDKIGKSSAIKEDLTIMKQLNEQKKAMNETRYVSDVK